jgi:lipid II:glycine glycyltransferase (peptidoglycan interpeptide bridge formation enzyme)
MKSKTRYNIRLADRKGVTVRQGTGSDLGALYKMYADTSLRAGFAIRDENYYQTVWKIFMETGENPEFSPEAQPLLAEYTDQLLAGAVIFRFGKRAWYLHGMSSVSHSEKMAPHLIQWEAMRWAKTNDCLIYDMWGAPDAFETTDPLWGVYRFKRGYGGRVSRTIGAWDVPAKPIYYWIYNQLLPRILAFTRWIGGFRTRSFVREQ